MEVKKIIDKSQKKILSNEMQKRKVVATIDFLKPIKSAKDLVNVQLMKREVNRLNKQIHEMRKFQALVVEDILSVRETATTFTGNQYPSYASAVDEIDSKYNGTADWGVLQTGNIIDLRSAFIISEGVKIKKKVKGAKAEMEFCENLFRYNNIDREVAQEYAKEAEIEGKILVKLAWEKDDEMVSVRYVSWTSKRYKVKTASDDYMKYESVSWDAKGDKKADTLEEDDFVYKKFGGRINAPNEAQPKIMKCLTQIDNLDKALRDWREINRLYGSPIPEFKCDTAKEAKETQVEIDKMNWKIKKAFAHTGDFNYKTPGMEGVTSIENEVLTNSKMISGTTGVPVHFLGFPDLLSNRATADNLMQLIYSATVKEREIWIGAYEEIIQKSMAIYNEEMLAQKSKAKKLDPTKVSVEIPFVSEMIWLHLEKVIVPLALSGKITDEYLLSQIPGLNVDEEMKRKADAEKSEVEKIKLENQSMKDRLAELETQTTEEELEVEIPS